VRPVAQTTQAQATQDQRNLPPIRVTGNRPKHRGKVRNPYRGTEAPTAPNPVRTPPIPGNVAGSNSSALAGIPITPLNAVAQTASRLGLPIIQTPASGAYRGAYVRRGVGVGIGAAAVGAAVIAPRYYTGPDVDIRPIRPANSFHVIFTWE
jgi:hypothetical protein